MIKNIIIAALVFLLLCGGAFAAIVITHPPGTGNTTTTPPPVVVTPPLVPPVNVPTPVPPAPPKVTPWAPPWNELPPVTSCDPYTQECCGHGITATPAVDGIACDEPSQQVVVDDESEYPLTDSPEEFTDEDLANFNRITGASQTPGEQQGE